MKIAIVNVILTLGQMDKQLRVIVEVKTGMVPCFVMFLEQLFAHVVMFNNPVSYQIMMAD